MSKIRVLMCPADKAPYMADIENKLEDMQNIVGGYIESITISQNPEVVLICDEEGRVNNPARLTSGRGLSETIVSFV